jgi:DNA-binding CsgD family transcriptional regulator
MDTCYINRLATAISSKGSPAFFSDLSEFLRSILKFENIIVLVYNAESTPTPAFTNTLGTDVFALLKSQYLSAAYLLDPVYQFHLQHGKPGIYWLSEMAPDNFLRSKYYDWYYGRIGILDEITIFYPVNETTTVSISMGTDTATGRKFITKDVNTLKEFEPVIQALIQADWDVRKYVSKKNTEVKSLVTSMQSIVTLRQGVKLSKRQAEVAILILRGHSSLSISLELGISPQTVKVFRRQLYSKCNISSQSELFHMMLPLLHEISIFIH